MHEHRQQEDRSSDQRRHEVQPWMAGASPLIGKRVVVVGGGSGMGEQVCADLLALGCKVWMVGRSRDRLDAAAARLASMAAGEIGRGEGAGRLIPGGELVVHPADATDDDQVRRLFETTGSIDHVVCTVADMRGAYERLGEIRIDAIERAIGSKVLAPMLLARRHGYDQVHLRQEDWPGAIGESTVDLVLDPHGTSNLDADLRALMPGGTIVLFGDTGGSGPAALPMSGRLMGGNAAIAGFSIDSLSKRRPQAVQAAMIDVLADMQQGRLTMDITPVEGLAGVGRAHDALASGQGLGKSVVRL